MRLTHFLLAAFLICALPLTARGQTRVAVLAASFDTAPPPPSGTLEQIQLTMGSVDAFYREQSYSPSFLTSDVYGVFTIPYSQNVAEVDSAVYQAALLAGVDVASYPTVYYFVDGGPPGPANMSSFTVSWDIVAHEFGHHIFGYFNHEHGMVCDHATGDCPATEYGNLFSIMGLGRGHFSAWLKAFFGWLPPIQEVTSTGDYTVTPLEIAGGVKAIKWHGGSRDSWPFFLEYRQPIGFDTQIHPWYDPSNVFQGVLIYRIGTADTTLLQVTPYVVGTLQAPALMVGQTYCDSLGHISVTTLSADVAEARVHVKFGGKC